LSSELEKDLLPMTPRNLRIVSSGVKSSSRWLPIINSLVVQSPPSYSSITIEAWSCCTISGAIRGTAIISLIKTESITIKLPNLLFRQEKRERRFTPLGFSTLTLLPSPNVGELPPITASTFITRSPDNTPLVHRASTSANPDPVISLAFVEANYKVLESLLRDRRRQVRNEDLRTKFDYYSEEYDEEREMEPRPTRVREATLALRTGSPPVRKHRGRVVEFEEAPNRDGSMVEMESDGRRPSERRVEEGGSRGVNLPPLLPSTNLGGNLPPNAYGQPPSYSYHTQDFTGYVTHFVHWIKDYPLSDGLKIPSYVGSYDGKGDPDNYLHLFECAIRMQKWAMLVACHMFTYTLKDFTRIWWNGQNAGNICIIKQGDGESTRAFFTRTKSLVEFLSTDLPTTYKGLIEKTYTWIKAKVVSTNGVPNDHKEGFNKFNKGSSWHNNKGRKKNWDMFSLYKGSNHGLLVNLSKSQMEILATEKAAKAFEQPHRMVWSRRSRDMFKYCHFHEDHGHETNQCRELRHQIKEAVKSGQLAHLVKCIKKGNAKASDTQLGKWKKGDKDIVRAEALILMVNRESHTSKRKSTEESINGIWEITFPSVSSFDNSSDLVIIRVRIFRRQVNRSGFQDPTRRVLRRAFMASRRSPSRSHYGRKSLHKDKNPELCHRQVQLTLQPSPRKNNYAKNWYRSVHDLCSDKIPHSLWNWHCILNLRAQQSGIRTEEGQGNFPKGYKRDPEDHYCRREALQYEALIERVQAYWTGKKKKHGLSPKQNETACKERLRSINVKLNPKKCSFDVEDGPFLGNLITKYGIKANPLKVKAIIDLKPPRTLKEIQSLNGKLAALSQFLSKGTNKSLPFLKSLKVALTRRKYNG
nr:reverse transcriptase domain-containing protein [Tanacetum cinerariifolium]